MFEFIGGIILGGIVSWVIARRFYLLAHRDQQILFNKLTSDVRETILSDKRESITVSQLNDLLRKKTLDASGNNELPYKVCPKCGSDNLIRNKDFLAEDESGDDGLPFQTPIPYKTIECVDCGWKDDEVSKDYKRIMQ
jgi:Zn ribbon nucleic-acid-binding protein